MSWVLKIGWLGVPKHTTSLFCVTVQRYNSHLGRKSLHCIALHFLQILVSKTSVSFLHPDPWIERRVLNNCDPPSQACIEYQRLRGKCNILMLILRVWHLSGSALPWRHLVGYLDVPLTSHFGYLDVPVASHTLLATLSSHLLAACPSTSTRTCKWLSVQLQCGYYLHLDEIEYRVSFCHNPWVITGNLGLILSLLFWTQAKHFEGLIGHGKPFLPSEPWFRHLGHILGSSENGPGDAKGPKKPKLSLSV